MTDAGQNPVAGAPVTFEVLAGGGTVDASASAVVATDADGRASVRLTLGPDPGLDNHLVEASFAGLANEPATFTASSFTLGDPAATRISGAVLDNQGDPVPATTLRIRGTSLSTVANAAGQFALAGLPAGEVVLEVDPSTTTRAGVWASLDFDLHGLPGVDNTLAAAERALPSK